MDRKWENLTTEMSVVLVKMEPSDMLNLVQESSHCRCCFKTIEFYEAQHPADGENLQKLQNILNMTLEPSQLAASFCGSCFDDISKFSDFQEVASSRQKMFLENRSIYEIHRLKTENEEPEVKDEPFEVPVCDIKVEDEFLSLTDLRNSQRSSKKSRNSRGAKPPQCPHCFTETYNMPKHLKSCLLKPKLIVKNHKSVSRKRFQCKFCFFRSCSLKNLDFHMNEKHVNDPKKKCRYCDFEYLMKSAIRNHMKAEHAEIYHDTKPKICSICGLSYKNLKALNMHVEIVHDKIIKFECDACGKKFSNMSSFKLHWKGNHGTERIVCDVCGKCYASNIHLKRHKRSIHDDTIYKCTQCDRTFNSQNNFRLHMRGVHMRETRHECKTCGSRFFKMADLKYHELKHKNIKFKCYVPGCTATFTRDYPLTCHIKKSHDLSPEEKEIYLTKLVNFCKKINVYGGGIGVGKIELYQKT